MTRSELVKLICQKNNISISELARKIGQTPQNFNKKLLRNTLSETEFSMILLELNVSYEQTIKFSDGSLVNFRQNEQ